MLGVRFGKLILKADFQFLGNYNLLNSTAYGGSISFGSPRGIRLIAMTPAYRFVSLGAAFEYLQFGTQAISTTGEVVLSQPLTLWQIGIIAGISL